LIEWLDSKQNCVSDPLIEKDFSGEVVLNRCAMTKIDIEFG